MALELIGRDHPAGLLRAEIDRVADSHGGLVLVTGEAGIGKTTLVTDAMEAARRGGALVLSGSCWDSAAAPGFWPWTQVVRGLRRHAAEGEWAAVEQAAGGALAALLGDAPDGTSGPADGFQLYDAVTSALVAVSQRRPVVVVLDDLHWADPASVRLLEFVAQHTWFERLLIVGTYRDVEVEAGEHELRPLLLPLSSRATMITLTGLDHDQVGALITRTVGETAEPDLVAEVFVRTGGNPFFVEQTARLWHSGNSVTAVAPGVRDAVRRRLSLLPELVSRLLTAAAVLGREFHRQVLAATVGQPVAQVDRLLAQAVTARLVSTLGDGMFAFSHDLVRETLYESLSEDQVRARHAAVVRALDRSTALADRLHAADLARHAFLARGELDVGTVVDRLIAAAREGRRRLAFEESIGHYQRALELLDHADPRRARINLDVGTLIFHSIDSDTGWAHLSDAATVALELDEPELLARVALTLYGLLGSARQDKLTAEVLRAAHAKLIGEDSEPRSLDHLAQALILKLISLARSDGDDDTLGFSLWTQHDTMWGQGHAADRLKLTDELASVAKRIGDTEMEHYATSLGWVSSLELGDPRYYERFREFVAVSARDEIPNMVVGSYMDQSIIAAFRGDFERGEHMLEQTAAASTWDNPHVGYMIHHLRWALLNLRGHDDELDALRESLVVEGINHPYPALLEGITAAQRGDVATAVRCRDELAARTGPMPMFVAPLWMRLRAMTAALAGEPAECDKVRAELAPYVEQWLVSMYGCDISGPVAHWVAVLDAARQRWNEAIEGFTAARRSADLLGSPPWSLTARAALAEALLGRGTPEDKTAAAALQAEVAREAAALGLRHLAGSDAPSPSPNEFRRTGETWTLSMAGRTVHMPDTKGLRDLHVLLAAPGTEVAAVRLLNPSGEAPRLGGDSVLDDEAKSRYRQRLATLDDQIDAATLRGDDTRAAAYDQERTALLTELRSAAGLGGRTRRLGDEAERARKTVTARIRDTLRKLADRHPELTNHLRESISTGSTCTYQPSTPTTWRL